MRGPNTQFVIDWTNRMAWKFGGTVYEVDGGKSWDWGQALCREVYGKGWSNDPQFLADDELPDVPDWFVEAAQKWEAGEWPAWSEKLEARR